MAERLRRISPPPRDDSRATIDLLRVYASAYDPTRQALVRVETPTGVVFTPLDGSPETVWPVLMKEAVEQLVVAPDGSLYAATLDGVYHLTGPEAPQLRKLKGGALSLAIDAAGNLAAGTGRGSIWIGDGHPDFAGYMAHESRVEAVDRQGSIVVSGGVKSLVVWADLERDEATTLSGHVAAVTAITLVHPTLAISGGADGTLKAWGGPERKLIWSARLPNGGPVHALAHQPGRILATGRDRAIWAWHPEDGRCLGLWTGHHRSIAALHPIPDGSFWTRSGDRSYRHWVSPPQPEPPPFFGHSDGVRAVLIEQGTLFTASRDGTVRRWELATQQPSAPAFQVSAGAVQVLLRHGPDTLFWGGTDGAVGIVDHGGTVLHRQHLHEGPVTSLIRLNDDIIVSGGADGMLRSWDAQRVLPLAARSDHQKRVRCLAVYEDTVVSGSYDGTLARVSPFGGPVLARMEGHTRPVVGVATAGAHIVSGSLDGTIRCWDPTGREVATGTCCPTGVVGLVPLSHERVVTVTKGGKASLWSVPELVCLDTLDLGYSLDGLGVGQQTCGRPVVVAGDQRGSVHVLQLESTGDAPSEGPSMPL